MSDAVVIGAGPNGLVAANRLADAGWSVTVLEAQPEPGGAVRSHQPFGPGIVVDRFSALYPLAAASPVLTAFDLGRYGLNWVHAPAVLAHPLVGPNDARAAMLHRDPQQTADGLDALHPGDGAAWTRLYGLWKRIGPALLDALFVPFPPVRPALRLLAALRASGGLHAARLAVLPVRRLLEEEFAGPGGLLLAGNAMHTDLAPEAAGSALYGFLLTMVGQQLGFPVPEGGAGKLTEALVRRLEAHGGAVVCDSPVSQVIVRRGRAVGVRTADGRELSAARAVLADVDAPSLYTRLLDPSVLPASLLSDLQRFQWDYATVKVNWHLSGPVPWRAAEASLGGTVHLADDLDELTGFAADLARGRVPGRPLVLVGQMSVADRSRSPDGESSVWAYTHVPRRIRGDAGAGGGPAISGSWDAAESELIGDRIQHRLDQYAPGFSARVRARSVQTPPDLQAHDANLVGGAIGGGTSSLHQQLVFRPTPGLGRPETPVRGLYLASASAHPGGGVHGACGANAARAALADGRARRTLFSAAQRRLSRNA